MKTRKIPLRTCVVTKEKLEKKALLRIVRTPDGKILPDLTGKANGRGAYLKADLETFQKAYQTKILDKHLESKLSENDYEQIKEAILNYQK